MHVQEHATNEALHVGVEVGRFRERQPKTPHPRGHAEELELVDQLLEHRQLEHEGTRRLFNHQQQIGPQSMSDLQEDDLSRMHHWHGHARVYTQYICNIYIIHIHSPVCQLSAHAMWPRNGVAHNAICHPDSPRVLVAVWAFLWSLVQRRGQEDKEAAGRPQQHQCPLLQPHVFVAKTDSIYIYIQVYTTSINPRAGLSSIPKSIMNPSSARMSNS